jgi:uncharacterized ferritin-like protein (DUF455 family)
MQNNFYLNIKKILIATTQAEKTILFKRTYQKFLNNEYDFTSINEIEIFEKPAYSSFCNIVDQRKVPQRKNLASEEGQVILLHAIAHIEYSAIDLALDACYRFHDMPKEFYQDWMKVASDELRHFHMLNDLLETYGVKYGDIDVHQVLFDACMKTQELIPRMALIPRYMEANGLDANAMMIDKLKKIPNTDKIIDLLEIILEEEVDHVKRGDVWYKYACSQKEDFTCDYFQVVDKVYPNSFRTNKHINVQARKRAGFSDDEINILLNK